jgi:N-acyl-D-aspartate/D-glutamate deacylase
MILDIKHELLRRGGAENIVVIDYPDKSYIGKTIAKLAAEQNISVIDFVIKLQMEGFADRAGGAHLRGFSLSEYDVENFLRQPWVAVSTDAINTLPQDGHNFLAHARFYGNYPRLFEHYVKDRGIISLEHAVRASTSLPALIFGIEDRGMIQIGYYADLVIMNLDNIKDKATFLSPHQYPDGIDFVFVNGQLVVENGELTGKKPGIVLSRRN